MANFLKKYEYICEHCRDMYVKQIIVEEEIASKNRVL